MAEEQKPVVEVPKDTPATEPATETKVEETPAATSEPTAEAAATTAEASTAAEEIATPAAEEAPKEDVTPIEAGSLEHKGSMFPKNFMYTKKFFWFGTEPVDTKAIASFKADKVAEVAHHVTAWAAETGKGLLFYGEKSDKSAPHGAIQLSEASEPVVDGTNKFHLTSKGHKHTFKAGSATERDNWVNQLKLNIAEAKGRAETIKETETYKNTLASLKAVTTKKEEKAPAAAEPALEEAGTAVETSKDGAEAAVEEPKKEEPKRRSASRKRTSIFGLIGKKEEKHVAAAPETEAPAESSTAAATETTDAAAETASPEATPATETAVETRAEETKPSPVKRASIFGGSFFHKKKAVSPEASATSPSEEAPASTTEAVAETAPVIPAVETSEPLSTDVSSPATVPTETVEAVAPATNGETKKEVKSEKRKSSYPFGLMGKKDKPTSDEDGAAVEKPKSPGPFSKLRATITRRPKSDKPAEEASAGDKAEDATKPAADGAEASTSEPIKDDAVEPVAEEPVAVTADKPVATAPVVAPVA